MANYQTLKAAINAVIKANGNKEITGTVLNEVLLAMVNSLGAGYQFAGVATPSTNPGTPDQNVFYLAGQAGMYTNFNSIALPDGVSILKWNGSWSGETVVAGDGVFDISAYKATGGTLATFADLSAALDGGNNIPKSLRKGGMSVKFVRSSDNKYVQYRLMSNSFTTTADDWQGVDVEPTADSKNLVESNGAYVKAKEFSLGIPDLMIGKNIQLTSSGKLDIVELANRSVIWGVTNCFLKVKSGYTIGMIYDINQLTSQYIGSDSYTFSHNCTYAIVIVGPTSGVTDYADIVDTYISNNINGELQDLSTKTEKNTVAIENKIQFLNGVELIKDTSFTVASYQQGLMLKADYSHSNNYANYFEYENTSTNVVYIEAVLEAYASSLNTYLNIVAQRTDNNEEVYYQGLVNRGKCIISVPGHTKLKFCQPTKYTSFKYSYNIESIFNEQIKTLPNILIGKNVSGWIGDSNVPNLVNHNERSIIFGIKNGDYIKVKSGYTLGQLINLYEKTGSYVGGNEIKFELTPNLSYALVINGTATNVSASDIIEEFRSGIYGNLYDKVENNNEYIYSVAKELTTSVRQGLAGGFDIKAGDLIKIKFLENASNGQVNIYSTMGTDAPSAQVDYETLYQTSQAPFIGQTIEVVATKNAKYIWLYTPMAVSAEDFTKTIEITIVSKLDQKFLKYPKLRGKKVLIMGDSIAYGVGATPDKNWANLLWEKAGCEITNMAISGTTIQYCTPERDAVYSSIYTLSQNTDFSGYDVLILLCGTNDINWNIGEPTDQISTSACGALNLVFQNVFASNPSIKIAYFSPFFRARFSQGDGKNSDDYSLDGKWVADLANKLVETCQKNHVTAKNLYKEFIVGKYNSTTYLSDGLHPNAAGYNLLSDIIASFVENNTVAY